MKLCVNCRKLPATRRGVTCSPACAYEHRYGKKETDSTVPGSPSKPSEEHDKKGDSWLISLNRTRIKSLEELVEHCSIDLRVWQVERWVCNKWEVGAKDESGSIKTEPLFQVKAWLKRNSDLAFAVNEFEALKEQAKKFSVKVKGLPRPRIPSGNMLEISIPDIHVGKLAWARETGDNYDTPIAVKRYSEALDSLVARVSGYKLDEIVLVVGNDMFHVDTRSNTTTGGTPQDTDSRYHKVFKIVRKMITEKIKQLREIAPVRVVVVSGNHDELTSWHLGDSLECTFEGYEDVTIDNEPCARKFHQFGEVMLMWVHGDKGKRSDYPLIMATSERKMWGKTKFSEIHCGHLHTTRVDEFHGARVRILPSLCGTDYWHSANGYTGNVKCAEGFLWNKEQGLLSIGYHTVNEDQ